MMPPQLAITARTDVLCLCNIRTCTYVNVVLALKLVIMNRVNFDYSCLFGIFYLYC